MFHVFVRLLMIMLYQCFFFSKININLLISVYLLLDLKTVSQTQFHDAGQYTTEQSLYSVSQPPYSTFKNDPRIIFNPEQNSWIHLTDIPGWLVVRVLQSGKQTSIKPNSQAFNPDLIRFQEPNGGARYRKLQSMEQWTNGLQQLAETHQCVM